MKSLTDTAIYIKGCSTFMKDEIIDEMIRVSAYIFDIATEEMSEKIDKIKW